MFLCMIIEDSRGEVQAGACSYHQPEAIGRQSRIGEGAEYQCAAADLVMCADRRHDGNVVPGLG